MMLEFIRRLLRRPKPEPLGTFIVPSGSTWDEPCHICGEMPFFEPHQIYVKPICEWCFWEVDDPIAAAVANPPPLPD